MGQKSHPVGLRLGYVKPWSSRWYADRDYAKILHEDIRVRKTVKGKLYHAGVSKVEIERSGDQVTVIIHTARPGIIIGGKGAEVDTLKADLDYGFAEAHTTMGQIGIKAWIYKGEILPAVARGKAEGELERR